VLILGAKVQLMRQGTKGHLLMRLKFVDAGSHRAGVLHSGTSMSKSSTRMQRQLACSTGGVLSNTN